MRFAGPLLALAACTSAAPPPAPPAPDGAGSGLPRARVAVVTQAGARLAVHAEIAADPATRARGLMFRQKVPEGEGMLFVFPAPEVHTFWMKNVPIPLDMIFVGEDLRVVGTVENAAPHTVTGRSVPAPSLYVLEVAGGWCARHGVRAGDRLELLDPLPPARP